MIIDQAAFVFGLQKQFGGLNISFDIKTPGRLESCFCRVPQALWIFFARTAQPEISE